ncbi:unnamed protein product [Amoebophrya sp. A25]|nr:unnamed protein product [Amoebophrya sp. A25]|eukprot:GSA25T00009001001.1
MPWYFEAAFVRHVPDKRETPMWHQLAKSPVCFENEKMQSTSDTAAYEISSADCFFVFDFDITWRPLLFFRSAAKTTVSVSREAFRAASAEITTTEACGVDVEYVDSSFLSSRGAVVNVASSSAGSESASRELDGGAFHPNLPPIRPLPRSTVEVEEPEVVDDETDDTRTPQPPPTSFLYVAERQSSLDDTTPKERAPIITYEQLRGFQARVRSIIAGGVASREHTLAELTKKLQAWRDCSKAAEYVKHTVWDRGPLQSPRDGAIGIPRDRDIWPTRHRVCSDVLKRGMNTMHERDQFGPRGYKDPPTSAAAAKSPEAESATLLKQLDSLREALVFVERLSTEWSMQAVIADPSPAEAGASDNEWPLCGAQKIAKGGARGNLLKLEPSANVSPQENRGMRTRASQFGERVKVAAPEQQLSDQASVVVNAPVGLRRHWRRCEARGMRSREAESLMDLVDAEAFLTRNAVYVTHESESETMPRPRADSEMVKKEKWTSLDDPSSDWIRRGDWSDTDYFNSKGQTEKAFEHTELSEEDPAPGFSHVKEALRSPRRSFAQSLHLAHRTANSWQDSVLQQAAGLKEEDVVLDSHNGVAGSEGGGREKTKSEPATIAERERVDIFATAMRPLKCGSFASQSLPPFGSAVSSYAALSGCLQHDQPVSMCALGLYARSPFFVNDGNDEQALFEYLVAGNFATDLAAIAGARRPASGEAKVVSDVRSGEHVASALETRFVAFFRHEVLEPLATVVPRSQRRTSASSLSRVEKLFFASSDDDGGSGSCEEEGSFDPVSTSVDEGFDLVTHLSRQGKNVIYLTFVCVKAVSALTAWTASATRDQTLPAEIERRLAHIYNRLEEDLLLPILRLILGVIKALARWRESEGGRTQQVDERSLRLIALCTPLQKVVLYSLSSLFEHCAKNLNTVAATGATEPPTEDGQAAAENKQNELHDVATRKYKNLRAFAFESRAAAWAPAIAEVLAPLPSMLETSSLRAAGLSVRQQLEMELQLERTRLLWESHIEDASERSNDSLHNEAYYKCIVGDGDRDEEARSAHLMSTTKILPLGATALRKRPFLRAVRRALALELALPLLPLAEETDQDRLRRACKTSEGGGTPTVTFYRLAGVSKWSPLYYAQAEGQQEEEPQEEDGLFYLHAVPGTGPYECYKWTTTKARSFFRDRYAGEDPGILLRRPLGPRLGDPLVFRKVGTDSTALLDLLLVEGGAPTFFVRQTDASLSYGKTDASPPSEIRGSILLPASVEVAGSPRNCGCLPGYSTAARARTVGHAAPCGLLHLSNKYGLPELASVSKKTEDASGSVTLSGLQLLAQLSFSLMISPDDVLIWVAPALRAEVGAYSICGVQVPLWAANAHAGALAADASWLTFVPGGTSQEAELVTTNEDTRASSDKVFDTLAERWIVENFRTLPHEKENFDDDKNPTASVVVLDYDRLPCFTLPRWQKRATTLPLVVERQRASTQSQAKKKGPASPAPRRLQLARVVQHADGVHTFSATDHARPLQHAATQLHALGRKWHSQQAEGAIEEKAAPLPAAREISRPENAFARTFCLFEQAGDDETTAGIKAIAAASDEVGPKRFCLLYLLFLEMKEPGAASSALVTVDKIVASSPHGAVSEALREFSLEEDEEATGGQRSYAADESQFGGGGPARIQLALAERIVLGWICSVFSMGESTDSTHDAAWDELKAVAFLQLVLHFLDDITTFGGGKSPARMCADVARAHIVQSAQGTSAGARGLSLEARLPGGAAQVGKLVYELFVRDLGATAEVPLYVRNWLATMQGRQRDAAAISSETAQTLVVQSSQAVELRGIDRCMPLPILLGSQGLSHVQNPLQRLRCSVDGCFTQGGSKGELLNRQPDRELPVCFAYVYTLQAPGAWHDEAEPATGTAPALANFLPPGAGVRARASSVPPWCKSTSSTTSISISEDLTKDSVWAIQLSILGHETESASKHGLTTPALDWRSLLALLADSGCRRWTRKFAKSISDQNRIARLHFRVKTLAKRLLLEKRPAFSPERRTPDEQPKAAKSTARAAIEAMGEELLAFQLLQDITLRDDQREALEALDWPRDEEAGTFQLAMPVISHPCAFDDRPTDRSNVAHEDRAVGGSPGLQGGRKVSKVQNYSPARVRFLLLRMGFGKTKVLSPLVSMLFLYKGFLPITVMPPALFQITQNDLRHSLREAQIHVQPFFASEAAADASALRRLSAEEWEGIADRLRLAVAEGTTTFVAQPFQIRALAPLEDIFWHQWHRMRESSSAATHDAEPLEKIKAKAAALSQVNALVRESAHLLLDEMDDLMRAGTSVVLPLGEQVALGENLLKTVVCDWLFDGLLGGKLLEHHDESLLAEVVRNTFSSTNWKSLLLEAARAAQPQAEALASASSSTADGVQKLGTAFVEAIFSTELPAALAAEPGRDYGFSFASPSLGIVIPYGGPWAPRESSRFQKPWQSVFRTVLLLLSVQPEVDGAGKGVGDAWQRRRYMRAFLLDLARRADADAVEAKKQLLDQYVKEAVGAKNRRGHKITQEPAFQQVLAESLSPARGGVAAEDAFTFSEAAQLVAPTETAKINDAFAGVMQEVDTEGPAREQGLPATPRRTFGARPPKKEGAASEALVMASLRAFAIFRANLLQSTSGEPSGGEQRRVAFSFFRAYFRFLCRKVFSDKYQLGIYLEYSEGTSIDLATTGAAITGWSGTEEEHEAFPYWVKKDRRSDTTEAIYQRMARMPSPQVRVINTGSPAQSLANTPAARASDSDGHEAAGGRRLSPVDLLSPEAIDSDAKPHEGAAKLAPLHGVIDAGALLWNFHEEEVATSFLRYFLDFRNSASRVEQDKGRAMFPAVAVAFHTFSGRLAVKVGEVKTIGAERVWTVRAKPIIMRGSDHEDIERVVVKDLKLHELAGVSAEEWRRLLFCYYSTKRTTGVDFPLPKTKARALLTSGPRVAASRLRQAALRARQFLEKDGQQLQVVVTDEALKIWEKAGRESWTGGSLAFSDIISAATGVEASAVAQSQLYALQLTMRGLASDFAHRARANFFSMIEVELQQRDEDKDTERAACLVAGQDLLVQKVSETERDFGYESLPETDDGTPQGHLTTMLKEAENLQTSLTAGVYNVAEACKYQSEAVTTIGRINSVRDYLKKKIQEESESSSSRVTAGTSEDAGSSWLQGQKEMMVEQEEDREEEQEMERESERDLAFGFGSIRIYEPSPEDGKLEVRCESSSDSADFRNAPVGMPLIPLAQMPLPTRAQLLVKEFKLAGSIGSARAAPFLDGFYLSRRFPVFFKPEDGTTGMPQIPIDHPKVSLSWSVRSLDLRLLRRACVFFVIFNNGETAMPMRVSAPAFFFAETIQDCRLARDAMMDGRNPEEAHVVFERVLDFSPVIPAGGGQEFDFLQSATVHMPDEAEISAKQGGALSLSGEQQSQTQMALCEMSIRTQLLLGDSQMLLRLLRYEERRELQRRLEPSSKTGLRPVVDVCGDTHPFPYTRTMLRVICNGATKGSEAPYAQTPLPVEVEEGFSLTEEAAAKDKVTDELQLLVDTYCPTLAQRLRLRLFLATTKNDGEPAVTRAAEEYREKANAPIMLVMLFK